MIRSYANAGQVPPDVADTLRSADQMKANGSLPRIAAAAAAAATAFRDVIDTAAEATCRENARRRHVCPRRKNPTGNLLPDAVLETREVCVKMSLADRTESSLPTEPFHYCRIKNDCVSRTSTTV